MALFAPFLVILSLGLAAGTITSSALVGYLVSGTLVCFWIIYAIYSVFLYPSRLRAAEAEYLKSMAKGEDFCILFAVYRPRVFYDCSRYKRQLALSSYVNDDGHMILGAIVRQSIYTRFE